MNNELETQITVTKNDESYSPAVAGSIAAAEAWLKAACAMAVKFPRDMDKVRGAILHECARPSFAAAALYAKPIGNSKVTGLSIRFAEGAIKAMKHLHVTTATLAETDEWRKIEVKVWDAQDMISYADEATIQKTIERKSITKAEEPYVIRRRANRQGELLYVLRAEEGDLLNSVNAAKSKAIRNCGLRCVPGWLLDECKDAINETMRKNDAADPDAAKRELYDAFSALGVGVDLIKTFLGHENTSLQPAELQELRKLYTAIKSGETTIQVVISSMKAEKGPEEAPSGKGMAGLKQTLSGKVITKDEAKKLDETALANGWNPMEWSARILNDFGVPNSDKLLAQNLAAALKLASGQ